MLVGWGAGEDGVRHCSQREVVVPCRDFKVALVVSLVVSPTSVTVMLVEMLGLQVFRLTMLSLALRSDLKVSAIVGGGSSTSLILLLSSMQSSTLSVTPKLAVL